MQADAFLFDALVAVRRLGDRRAPDLRPHAAVAAQARRRRADGRARARRDRRGGARARARRRARSPSSRTSSPTSRTRPATRCRRAKRERLLELARAPRLHDLRGRPVRGAALRGLAAADDALDGRRRRSSTRPRSRRPSAPGSASATWSGRAELIARIVKIATSTYISPNMVAAGDRPPVLPLGRARALDRDRASEALRERAETLCARAASASFPRRASSSPRAATSCGSTCRAAPTSARCSTPPPSAASQFVKGIGLRAGGRRDEPAAGLLRRDARRDRGGRRVAWPRPTASWRAPAKMRPEEIEAVGDLAGEAAAGAARQIHELHTGIAGRVLGRVGPAPRCPSGSPTTASPAAPTRRPAS